jgi:hypothetical protein
MRPFILRFGHPMRPQVAPSMAAYSDCRMAQVSSREPLHETVSPSPRLYTVVTLHTRIANETTDDD